MAVEFEIPVWIQSLGMLAGTGIAAFFIQRENGKKEKAKRHEEIGEGGEEQASKVVAASFVDGTRMDRLTAKLGDVNEQLVQLNEHLTRGEQARREERVAREAAEHAAMRALLKERGVEL